MNLIFVWTSLVMFNTFALLVQTIFLVMAVTDPNIGLTFPIYMWILAVILLVWSVFMLKATK